MWEFLDHDNIVAYHENWLAALKITGLVAVVMLLPCLDSLARWVWGLLWRQGD